MLQSRPIRNRSFHCILLMAALALLVPQIAAAADPPTKFDYRAAATEAAAKYPLRKVGDHVQVSTPKGTVAGKFTGIRNGAVVVNGVVVCQLRDLSEDERAQFDRDVCDAKRQDFIAQRQREFNKARQAPPKVDSGDAGSGTVATTPKNVPRQDAKVVPSGLAPIKGIHPAILKNAASGLAANALVWTVGKANGELEDCRVPGRDETVQIPRAALNVFQDLGEGAGPLDVTQRMLVALADGDSKAAAAYLALAKGFGYEGNRIRQIRSVGADVAAFRRELDKAAVAIRKLDKDRQAAERRYAASEQGINDRVFQGIDTRQTHATKHQQLCTEIERQHNGLSRQREKMVDAFVSSVEELASAGDFPAACVLGEFSVDQFAKLEPLLERLPQPDERYGNSARSELSSDRLRIDVERIICRQYDARWANPLKSRLLEIIALYNDIYGVSEGDLARHVTTGGYPTLRAKVKESFSALARYRTAAVANDLPGMMEHGLKLLCVMPDADDATDISDGLFRRLDGIAQSLVRIGQLFAAGDLRAVLDEGGKITPPPAIYANTWKPQAEQRIAECSRMIEQARSAYAGDDIALVIESLTAAKAAWPKSAEAIDLEREYNQSYEIILASIGDFDRHLQSNRFTDAEGIADRIRPKHENFARKLDARITERRAEHEARLARAENYIKAARYDDALAIYDELGHQEGRRRVLEPMLEQAMKDKAWPKAVAILESLERWGEAGTLRTEHNLVGKEVAGVATMLDPQEIFRRAKPAVFVVSAKNPRYRDMISTGSGFAIARRLVVTNRHVVTMDSVGMVSVRMEDIRIGHRDWDAPVSARIVAISPNRDLALLEVDRDLEHVLAIDTSPVSEGAKVYALGNPATDAAEERILDLTFTEGIVSRAETTIDGNPCIQTTAAINSGNSGGPLLNSAGKVIGVNTFGIKAQYMQGTFLAVKAAEIRSEFATHIATAK